MQSGWGAVRQHLKHRAAIEGAACQSDAVQISIGGLNQRGRAGPLLTSRKRINYVEGAIGSDPEHGPGGRWPATCRGAIEGPVSRLQERRLRSTAVPIAGEHVEDRELALGRDLKDRPAARGRSIEVALAALNQSGERVDARASPVLEGVDDCERAVGAQPENGPTKEASTAGGRRPV